VPGEADIASLSRQRGALNVAHRVAENGSGGPLHHHYRQAETWNLNAADQSGVGRLRQSPVGNLASLQQLFEMVAFPILKRPPVHQNKSAIAQRGHRTRPATRTVPGAESIAAICE
jgi:hypothetical protein